MSVEEMWPVAISDYEPPESMFAYAEVCLDRTDPRHPCQGEFTLLDLHVLHTESELYGDGWRAVGDGRYRRVWRLDSAGYVAVTDWEGASQEQPPPPRKKASGAGRMIPLYEAKMLHNFDTRWASYDDGGTCRPIGKP